jgi:hypothetical protein
MQVPTMVRCQILDFWAVVSCLACVYQHFGEGIYFYPKDRLSPLLWNNVKHWQDCMVPQPRRPQSKIYEMTLKS